MSAAKDASDKAATRTWFDEYARKTYEQVAPSKRWGFALRPVEFDPPLILKPGHTYYVGVDMAPTDKKPAKAEKFNTIGVRFPETPGTEWTYKVRIGAKPYLGQELVADTQRGQAVVFVTRIDKTPQAGAALGAPLKYIDRKTVAL